MPDEPERRELQAAPPFWSWNAFYIVLAAALAVEVAIFTAITLIYR